MSARATRERGVLRRHLWMVVLLTVLTTAAGAVAVALQPVTYVADAEVEVFDLRTSGTAIAPDMATERELATSGTVAYEAADTLGQTTDEAASGLEVSVVTDTKVLVFEYSASDERAAYVGARAFANAYLKVRNDRQKQDAATMITPPTVERASGTTGLVLVVACLLVGLALGAACAWLWDRVSGRVRSAPELARAGLPVLASGLAVPSDTIAVTWQGRKDFAYLAGRLDAEVGGRAERVRILVTSPRENRHRSTVALNVAAAVAGLGRGVVLVDADSHAAGVSSMGSEPFRPGLPDLLSGAASVTEVWRPIGVERVRLVPMPVRRLPFRPDVDALERVLDQLGETDVVVIDGPPLLEVAVSALLADHVDIVLLVGDLTSLKRVDVAACAELLQPASASLAGWVTYEAQDAHSELAVDPGADVAELPQQRDDGTSSSSRWRASRSH